jgi:peptidoglycan/LPS O-acetylase OafA/YrhL
LLFAASVVAWHCIPVGGFHAPARLHFLSDLGVDCFFVISGFLITRSWKRRSSVGRFLWHRFLRIFPALWVCLALTVVAGAIAWYHDRASLGGYLGVEHGPLSYLRSNWRLGLGGTDLATGHSDIAGTPAGVPYPSFWDVPLWTLPWELKCYLGVVALGLVGFVTRARGAAVVALFLMSYGLLTAVHFHPALQGDLPARLHGPALRFFTTFLCGAALYVLSDRIPADRRIAAPAAVAVLASFVFVDDYRIVALIPLAYLLIWVGASWRGLRLTAKHDVSYGTYIYGYVVTQLLAVFGLYRWGYVPFTLLAFAGTGALAIASWRLVERPALALKDKQLPQWRRRAVDMDRPSPTAAKPAVDAA